MMESLARAELFLLACVACGIAATVASSLFAPYGLRAVREWRAAPRYFALLVLAVAPGLGTVLLLGGSIAPALLSLLDPALDHCIGHVEEHEHLCFLHLPEHPPHLLLWFLVGSLAFWGVFRALVRTVELALASAKLRQLVQTGDPNVADGAIVLDGDVPFCASAGLLTPRVLVSRSLLRILTKEQREAMLAHERGHVRRRDALVRLGVRLIVALYPRSIRLRLERELDLAAEQACDDEAASVVGDRLVVAETILRVARAFTDASTASVSALFLAMGMHYSNVAPRVEALLAHPSDRGSIVPILSTLGVLLVVMAACSTRLHHMFELCLSPFLR